SQGPRLRLVGRVTVNGPGTLVNQIPLELTGDVINAPLDNQATVIAWGAGNEINGPYTATPGSGLRIEGRNPCDDEFEPPACGDAELTIGRDFTNRGPLLLTNASPDTAYYALLRMPAGTTLTNENEIRAEPGPDNQGGDRFLDVQLRNRGQVR